MTRAACSCADGQLCWSCEDRIVAAQNLAETGRDVDEQLVDVAADRYERALWAALGEAS